MKPVPALGLAIMALGVLACSKSDVHEPEISIDATFDLSSNQLGQIDASGIVHAVRELAAAATKPVTVRFTDDKRSIVFEVLLAEPAEDYELKPIVKGVDGKWVYPKPPAVPPGDIEPTWVRLTPDGTLVGEATLSDVEYGDWLDFYAGAIGSISERAALVVVADAGVSSSRLWDVLNMQALRGLNRFLVEKEAEPQR
ncbi:hypothetical protein [Haloferula sp.]|uniref:hypothetical protein n=1 Tax=Haloferula sp. TaxID=2497595 RepID=UPI003C74F128